MSELEAFWAAFIGIIGSVFLFVVAMVAAWEHAEGAMWGFSLALCFSIWIAILGVRHLED